MYIVDTGDDGLSKTAKREDGRASYVEYLELADWLEVVTQSLDRDFDVSRETKSDLELGLAHAEAALRRALSEIKLPK